MIYLYASFLRKNIKIIDIDDVEFVGTLDDIQMNYDDNVEELSVSLQNGTQLGINSNEIITIDVI